ncbi:MAG: type 1 glutamine amidotransferase [Candidatus Omnitrophica bacterium]|nr:hypothetical protein [bacterium]NUN96510.1 type 1 glutamine amidotransferase [Candidatus Omnitrophota bacterium]
MSQVRPILILNSVAWDSEYDPRDPLYNVCDWFLKAFGGDPARLVEWRAREDPVPDLSRFSAMVLTGSPASAYDNEAWIEALKSLVREAVTRRFPTLGVCFGSQLIAEAMGGKVERHMAGWELGDKEIELTPEGKSDPLFEGIPARFRAIESHQDAVVRLPPGAELLATNPFCPVQAFGVGEFLRAVQFHPEMGPEHLRFICPPRRARILESSGIDVNDLLPGVRETPDVAPLFRNFERHFACTGA